MIYRLALALLLVSQLAAQITWAPKGFNVRFSGSVSMVDIGGKPCVVVVGAPGVRHGLVEFVGEHQAPPGTTGVALKLLAALVFDPRPCALGGRPYVHPCADVCGSTANMPCVSGAPAPITATGYGLFVGDGGLTFQILAACSSKTPVTPWRFDYRCWDSVSTYSTSPCGGDADLLQCVVAEVVLL